MPPLSSTAMPRVTSVWTTGRTQRSGKPLPTPTRTTPAWAWRSSRSSANRSSAARSIWAARRRKATPNAVGLMPRAIRSKSFTRVARSMRAMALLRVPGDMPSVTQAALRLPSRPTTTAQ
ncbi:hypothetical protein D9M69_666360 [compost metagenome]